MLRRLRPVWPVGKPLRMRRVIYTMAVFAVSVAMSMTCVHAAFKYNQDFAKLRFRLEHPSGRIYTDEPVRGVVVSTSYKRCDEPTRVLMTFNRTNGSEAVHSFFAVENTMVQCVWGARGDVDKRAVFQNLRVWYRSVSDEPLTSAFPHASDARAWLASLNAVDA